MTQPYYNPPLPQYSREEMEALKKQTKQRHRKICANVMVLIFLILSFIFTTFLPYIKYSSTKYKKFSSQLSTYNVTYFMVNGILSMKSNKVIKNFEENGGKDLLFKDQTGEVIHREATDEQIRADVEFKRTYSPNAFQKKVYADMFVNHFETSVQKGYRELENELEREDLSDQQIQEALELASQEVEQVSTVMYSLADLVINDIKHFNFAGLKQFLTISFNDYSNNELTAEKFAENREAYLISNVSLETLVECFNENKDICMEAIYSMPGYADCFTLDVGDEIKLDDNVNGSFSTPACFIGIFMLLIAIFQLIYIIPVIVRMTRIGKSSSEAPGKKKKKERRLLAYMTFLNIGCLILAPILGVFQVKAPFVGGFAIASIVTIAVNLALFITEICATKRISK